MIIVNLMIDIDSSNVSGSAQKKNELYEELITSIGNGDIKALEMLYMHSKSEVYGYALSILKNPQSAEDIMQDTYVKLFHAAKNYKSQGKPIAWIMTMVRNQALSKFRDKDYKTVSIDDDSILLKSNDFTENSIDHAVLYNVLTILSDEERQIIILHSVSCLKHREISEIMELPLSTVLSKYRRALSKLKKRLKEEIK